jgi:hypothetical protein
MLVNVIYCFLFFKILVQDIMYQMLPQASCAVFSLYAKHKQYLKCPRFSPPSQLLQYDNMPAAASLFSETPIKTTICANTSIKIWMLYLFPAHSNSYTSNVLASANRHILRNAACMSRPAPSAALST